MGGIELGKGGGDEELSDIGSRERENAELDALEVPGDCGCCPCGSGSWS